MSTSNLHHLKLRNVPEITSRCGSRLAGALPRCPSHGVASDTALRAPCTASRHACPNREVIPCTFLRGFSLVELLSVLTIAGILMGIGVPGFRSLLQSQRLTTAANDFFISINLARSEAIKRGIRVDLVPTDAGGDWAKGWVVFIDKNNNQRPDAGEQVIFTHDPVPAGLTISASLTDSKVQYLAYNGYGRTRTNTSGEQTQFGTFAFRLDKGARKVKLNFLGRPRVCNPDTEPSTC